VAKTEEEKKQLEKKLKLGVGKIGSGISIRME